jgi:hypothetical protein
MATAPAPVKPATGGAVAEPSLHRVMGPWLLLLFIVGDILGTGIYALTGQVAKQVGGVVWLPFLVAFVVALITAFSSWSWSPSTRVRLVRRFMRTRRSACISSPSSSPSR